MKPIEQTKLYGYKNIFNELINIYKNNTLPNKILFSGQKGIGKSTFGYHLTNFIFSENEENNYILKKNEINKSNNSYNMVLNNIHNNFYQIKLKEGKANIEISQVREMINFANKSTFNNKNKIIFIDNVEHLNVYSSNALLKIMEELNKNTLFFLFYNNQKRILPTVKSRCIEFKLKINKENVFEIVNSYFNNEILNNLSNDFKNYNLTPANYINFIIFCKDNDIDYINISIEDFIRFIIKNNVYKKSDLPLDDIKIYLELFFRKKISNFSNYRFFYLYSYFNLKFNNIIKFNLDLESFFIEFNSKLLNE